MQRPHHRPLRVAAVLVLWAAALSACAAPTAAPTVVPTTSQPTIAATAAPPTTVPVATTDPADVVDATHARLRVGVAVKGGPRIDFLVNGAPAMNGGQAQVNIAAGYITAYLFLEPGTYMIGLVPSGEALAQALVPEQKVSLAAGHRYTLLVMGQLDDPTFTPLLIDETAEMEKIGAHATDTVYIIPNNLTGASGLDTAWMEEPINNNIPYNGFGAGIYRPGNGHIYMGVSGDSAGALIDDNPNWMEPGMDVILGFAGTYPGNPDVVEAAPTSDLDTIAFLQGFRGLDLKLGNNPVSFDTLLQAIETAGLTEFYAKGGPYLFLAPTDEAFASMPTAAREALLADPAALTQLLQAHTIASYIPRGAFGVTPGGAPHRTVLNQLGEELTIGDGFSINGEQVGDFNSYFVANGNQVHLVNRLALPTP